MNTAETEQFLAAQSEMAAQLGSTEQPHRLAGVSEATLELQMNHFQDILVGSAHGHKWTDATTGEIFDVVFVHRGDDFSFVPSHLDILAKGGEAGRDITYAGSLTTDEAHEEIRIRAEFLEQKNDRIV